MWTFGKVQVHWLGHDSIVLKGTRTVVIDPFKARGNFKADILLISHEHSDHLSPDDIRNFTDTSSTLVAPKLCKGALEKFGLEKVWVEPGSKLETKGVSIEAIPAYNLNKFREPGKFFHPREDGRVGYIVGLDGARFYHSGDSDATPEMKAVDVDVAFLPVSGTYVMTAEEAASAAKEIRAKVLVPFHVNKIVGTMADAERFRELVGAAREVRILEEE
ncbi:MAG: MBL fold metallo-hydrolase [Thaumarchaeota archaeon]|nr:MBL fold metallo-hydrolase [Nitrososphaerota archaeon]